jgi:hypothetical protein
MAKIKVSVEWLMCGTVVVESDNVQNAIDEIENNPDIPLPDDGDYVDGSFTINREMTEFFAKEKS